jgi:enoyl-CoA hydratase/carnithine racemase
MPAEKTGTVAVERSGEIATILLRRENKLNALSAHMEASLLEALGSEAVRGSRAVVISGGDTVFSAGADVTELREMTPESIAGYYRTSGHVYERVAELPVPTVAAITGYCLGGGCELALAADFRVADPRAEFGFPEVGIGILPSSGGITRLVRSIGPARTRDLVLRGRRFGPEEAERWGLVTEIADPGEHLTRAHAIARELTAMPALALELTTRVIDAAAESSTRTALLLEQLGYTALNASA